MWFTRPQDVLHDLFPWLTPLAVTAAGCSILAGPFAGYLAPGTIGQWASVLFLGLLLALGGGAWLHAELRPRRS